MTREEAIEWYENYIPYADTYEVNVDALKIGLNALQTINNIKQEIEQRIPKVEYDIGNGLAIAISIIDKHLKGESE